MKQSPFELIYGHKSWGLLQEMREEWESTGWPEVGIQRHRQEKIDRLGKAKRLAQENLAEAQWRQKREYDKGAYVHDFHVGGQSSCLTSYYC